MVGGEQLLCDCWESIARYASNKGFELSMISNGMLIDDTISKKNRTVRDKTSCVVSCRRIIFPGDEYDVHNIIEIYKTFFWYVYSNC